MIFKYFITFKVNVSTQTLPHSQSQCTQCTQCTILTPNQVPKQDATVQCDMAQEDDTWSLDGVIQKEMELLVLKKLK